MIIDLFLFLTILLFFPVLIWASMRKQKARYERLRTLDKTKTTKLYDEN